MTVTNVPGPQFPLYLLGSRMLESYALVPLWQAHGVGVALFSYAGSVYWGFNADYDIVPDVDAFAGSMLVAFEELHEAATGAETVKPNRPKPRPPLGKPAAEKAAAKKAAAKKPAAKKAPAKKAAAKKAPAKKAPAKKPAAKKAPAKKAPGRRF